MPHYAPDCGSHDEDVGMSLLYALNTPGKSLLPSMDHMEHRLVGWSAEALFSIPTPVVPGDRYNLTPRFINSGSPSPTTHNISRARIRTAPRSSLLVDNKSVDCKFMS